MEAESETSVGTATARTPRETHSRARSSSGSSRRAASTRWAPFLARASAVARPMPLDAPVMTTTRFFHARFMFPGLRWASRRTGGTPDPSKMGMKVGCAPCPRGLPRRAGGGAVPGYGMGVQRRDGASLVLPEVERLRAGGSGAESKELGWFGGRGRGLLWADGCQVHNGTQPALTPRDELSKTCPAALGGCRPPVRAGLYRGAGHHSRPGRGAHPHARGNGLYEGGPGHRPGGDGAPPGPGGAAPGWGGAGGAGVAVHLCVGHHGGDGGRAPIGGAGGVRGDGVRGGGARGGGGPHGAAGGVAGAGAGGGERVGEEPHPGRVLRAGEGEHRDERLRATHRGRRERGSDGVTVGGWEDDDGGAGGTHLGPQLGGDCAHLGGDGSGGK